MILSRWLATLGAGALALHSALAIELNPEDEGRSPPELWNVHPLTRALSRFY